MRRTTVSIFSFVFICLYASHAAAASRFELWSKSGFQYRITERVRTEFDLHLRIHDEASYVNSIMPELSLTLRAAKFLRFSIGYRFILKGEDHQGDPYLDSWHRFFADIRFRHATRPLTFKYRLRLQEQFGWPWDPDTFETSDSAEAKHTLRARVLVEWNTDARLDPFLAGELFIRFGDRDGLLHKWRATLGTDFDLGSHRCTVFYRLEGMLNGSGDPAVHILGLGYRYTI